MNILVTGGAGFIGSHLADALVSRGHAVRILDSLDPQVHPGGNPPSYLNQHAEFIKGDVRDRAAMKKALAGVEAVFHHAAALGVGQSQYKVEYFADVNARGTAVLMDILANEPHAVRKVVVASSMSGYGEGEYACPRCGTVKGAMRRTADLEKGDWNNYCPRCGERLTAAATREDARRTPNSIYAVTKMTQEEIVLNIGLTYGIPAVALRYFNVYGPRQSLSNPYTGVAAIFMTRIKCGKAPVVYEDGGQTRDFVSVADVVAANLLALEKSGADYHAVNIGGGVPTPVRAVAETLARLHGRPDIAPHITGTFRKGDIRHCFADLARARELLGYVPAVGFEEGMWRLIEWARTAEASDKFDLAAKELADRGLA
ncbi:MAG: SDR family NAD(P)-dependent oxidoreductase [Nitrospinae bacterium]|nr:SDR family NAD(P)-dependent oxidoreductase [Nitrospinota bacterium]